MKNISIRYNQDFRHMLVHAIKDGKKRTSSDNLTYNLFSCIQNKKEKHDKKAQEKRRLPNKSKEQVN